MSNETIREQAQAAVTDINCVHPDTAITGLEAVLERIGADSPDAARLKRAIDRLEELAAEMAQVERELSLVNWSFGQLEEV